MTCTHTRDRSEYVTTVNDWTGETESEWVYTTEHTTEDIGTGAYRCTQCGEVLYYTGLWRKFYEDGTPCSSSTLVRPDEVARVREAALRRGRA